jgi:hypothetical protein
MKQNQPNRHSGLNASVSRSKIRQSENLFRLLLALMCIPIGCDNRLSDPVLQAGYETRVCSGITTTASPYDYIKISVDPTVHNDYGLTYPVTYEFSIPSHSSDLRAYKRYNEAGSWSQITERTSSDFFNGIEATRFDYSNNKAFISIGFNHVSNDIHLKVTDTSGEIVDITYQGIPDYYDDRDAAVVATGDDWDGYPANNNGFKNACDAFTSRRIWFTAGLTTAGVRITNWPPVDWSDVQTKIDDGYIEVASHSKQHLMPNKAYSYGYTGTHTGTDNGRYTLTDSSASFPVIYQGTSQQYVANFVGWIIKNMTDGSFGTVTSSTSNTITCSDGLSGGTDNDWDHGDTYKIDRYDEEIGGSRNDIIDNLDLPTLNKKGNREYVYAWIEPDGYCDSVIREKLGQYKYLADRDTSKDNTFASWDVANSVYNRIGLSYQLGRHGSLHTTNNKFDSVVTAGGICHIVMHPRGIDWSAGSWVQKHLDYIRGRTNLWYVGFGHLYLYHYIDDHNIVNVAKILAQKGSPKRNRRSIAKARS